MPVIDTIKANLFSTPMPDMPPKLREIWQVAFMFRRKYSDPSNTDAEAYFKAAMSDMEFIVQSYGNNETTESLMLEVYLDIERQWKAHQARLESAKA
jgi:hypothetical protein